VTAPAYPLSGSLIDLEETFLPVGRMRQISRVTGLDGVAITAEMELGPDHWVWPEHFPDDPIFPGTLMLEAAGQLVALWAWAKGKRGRPRLVRVTGEFSAPVHPGTEFLLLEGVVKQKRQAYFGTIQLTSGDLTVGTVEIALVVLPFEGA
jgi:3-hydroxymyristoyl/3-hydroxydecanoyl-(acyl carrier protein) dehydratase